MNKTPSYILSDTFVSVVSDGFPVTIYKQDMRYPRVIDCIKNKDWEGLHTAVSFSKTILSLTHKRVSVKNDTLYYRGEKVNHSLTNKILKYSADGFDVLYLLKFLNKLFRNKNPRSIETLYAYIERYKMPINESGNFLALKAVTSDLKDKWTGTIDNSVGAIPQVKRKDCNTDPSNACSRDTLHCGNINYVKNYARGDDKIILVEVNPKDVVNCPNNCGFEKLQVCKYKVLKCLGDKNDVMAFDSEFVETKKIEPETFKLARDAKGRFISRK